MSMSGSAISSSDKPVSYPESKVITAETTERELTSFGPRVPDRLEFHFGHDSTTQRGIKLRDEPQEIPIVRRAADWNRTDLAVRAERGSIPRTGSRQLPERLHESAVSRSRKVESDKLPHSSAGATTHTLCRLLDIVAFLSQVSCMAC
jgi:hypothetical protein